MDILKHVANIVNDPPEHKHGEGMDAWMYLTRKKMELRKTHTAEETERIIWEEDGYAPDWCPE